MLFSGTELTGALIALTLSTGAGTLFYIVHDYLKSVWLALRLGGPRAIPIFGNILLLVDRHLIRDKAPIAIAEYGTFFRFWFFFIPIFIVTDPVDVKTVLAPRKNADKMFFYKLLHNFLGTGLITSSGESWKRNRRLLQPTFHLNVLKDLIECFHSRSCLLVPQLRQSHNAVVNIVEIINPCVLAILNETVFGEPYPEKNVKDDIKLEPPKKGEFSATYRTVRPWLLLDWLFKMTKMGDNEAKQRIKNENFIRHMIKKRTNLMSNSNYTSSTTRCLLDSMIEISAANPEFDEEQIISEASTFMVAGQEAVSTAIAFCLFMLAQHPECQQRCFDELNTIFDGSDRTPSLADVEDMRYVGQCLKETLRMYPTVPIIVRRLAEPITVKGTKYTLPARSNVAVTLYLTQRLPHIFPNPDTFDPNRFDVNANNDLQQHPYAFIPFSVGPRNCIGFKFAMIEMKCVIANVLRNFKLLPVIGKTKCQPYYRITLRAGGGLWLKFEPRTDTSGGPPLNSQSPIVHVAH